MYGYIRPLRDELKIREYELFRGIYCELCHTLRHRYGFLCRFLVNYDFTFYAMLLAHEEKLLMCTKRCPYHPRRRTMCPADCPETDTAADYTVVLAWWKLRDSVSDNGFIRGLPARILCRILRGAYRRAASRCPGFAETVENNLHSLAQLEKEKCSSADAAADTFADILRAAAGAEPDPERQRILRELLYHLGRIIYLLDAADDLYEDTRHERYNPLRYRFSPENGMLSDEDKAALRLTIQHSHNAIISAYSLLDHNAYSGIVENTIYLGLPAVTGAVFAGTWNRRISKKDRRNL